MDQLPFIPNQIYNRRADIHARFGGSWQGGIAPSASFPYVFIFSSQSGRQHGYKDDWDNNHVFSYSGEGQVGDMKFTKGNLALLNHKQNGRRVFLFEGDGRGRAMFKCEVELISYNTQAIPDREGNIREGITFFFKRAGAYVPAGVENLLQQQLVIAENFEGYGWNIPNVTERKGLVTSRVGQGAYRQRVILRWDSKCAVTGFEKPEVLIASHIVPWSSSTNEERVDPNNGILFSPTYDALFDRHLISFENSGKIILSENIQVPAFNKIGVTGREVLKKSNMDIHPYLERHRNTFYENH